MFSFEPSVVVKKSSLSLEKPPHSVSSLICNEYRLTLPHIDHGPGADSNSSGAPQRGYGSQCVIVLIHIESK